MKVTFGYASTLARASAIIFSGGVPSCPKKPCDAAAKRLRGAPASTMQTVLRARASCRAAERPAKLPPTTRAS
jgi:hypothetical protein